MKLSLEQLQTLAANVGFPDPALAAAVAMAESGGDTCAQGDPKGVFSCSAPNGVSTSFGLWQVNTPHNPQFNAQSLLDPNYNARAALAISGNGATWQPWTTFRNGSYLKWYSNAVYPPNGGTPVVPTPVVPPVLPKKHGVVAVTVGALALVAAAGYGAYKLFAARSFPEPEPEPFTYPLIRTRRRRA